MLMMRKHLIIILSQRFYAEGILSSHIVVYLIQYNYKGNVDHTLSKQVRTNRSRYIIKKLRTFCFSCLFSLLINLPIKPTIKNVEKQLC